MKETGQKAIQSKSCILSVIMPEDGNGETGPNPLLHERNIAIRELIHDSHFQPVNDDHGPYRIELSIEENRLVLRITNAKEEDLSLLVLSLRPYKRLIQDYFLMLRSYEEARKHASSEKLEAIDMGRRGLHNEGATLFMERLKDKIELDHETARRFFTLICALHKRELRMLA